MGDLKILYILIKLFLIFNLYPLSHLVFNKIDIIAIHIIILEFSIWGKVISNVISNT